MLVEFDLINILRGFPSTRGTTPSSLTDRYIPRISHEPDNIITISIRGTDIIYYEDNIRFLKQTENNKTVLTSTVCIKSTTAAHGIDIEQLPYVLTLLSRYIAADENIVAIQFPIAFGVYGAITGGVYRSHFNQLLIYKTADNNLEAVIIDSTNNPIGIVNPASWITTGFLGFRAPVFITSSILSGEELLDSKFRRLLYSDMSTNALQIIFGVSKDIAESISVQYPILTGVQATFPTVSLNPASGPDELGVEFISDKRCGIYVCKGFTNLINYFLADGAETVTLYSIRMVVIAAHQAVAAVPLLLREDVVPAVRPVSRP